MLFGTAAIIIFAITLFITRPGVALCLLLIPGCAIAGAALHTANNAAGLVIGGLAGLVLAAILISAQNR